MQCLTLTWYTEYELIEFFKQLLIANSSSAPTMHTEVTLRIKVAIRQDTCFAPVVQRFTLFVVEESHDTFLVKDISFLSDERSLHLVDRLLEELLILTNQKLLDSLKSTLTLRD